MRTIYALLTILFFSACSKSANKVNEDCDAQLIAKFKDQITCVEVPTMGPCNYLGKGIYKGALIYFIDIICATCNTIPPQEGYNCDGEKVAIENFNQNVTNVKVVSPEKKN